MQKSNQNLDSYSKGSFREALLEGSVDKWIKEGGDPNAHNELFSVLNLAIYHADLDPEKSFLAVSHLLDAGAKLKIKDNNILKAMAEEGRVDFLHLFLKKISESSSQEITIEDYKDALLGAFKGSNSFQHQKNFLSNKDETLLKNRALCATMLYPFVKLSSWVVNALIKEMNSALSEHYFLSYSKVFLNHFSTFEHEFSQPEKYSILSELLKNTLINAEVLTYLLKWNMKLNSPEGSDVVLNYIRTEIRHHHSATEQFQEFMGEFEKNGFSWTQKSALGWTIPKIIDVEAFKNEFQKTPCMLWIQSKYENQYLSESFKQVQEKPKVRL